MMILDRRPSAFIHGFIYDACMPAGYSKNPLVVKLGLRVGSRARFINQPKHYLDLLGGLPDGVKLARTLRGEFDFIHFFSTSQSELEVAFRQLKKHLAKDGTLWISWPKRASSIKNDLGENIVREIGLETGLVDVKVCAVDDDWSGLKFVWRLKDR